jgi:hypothetical protein
MNYNREVRKKIQSVTVAAGILSMPKVLCIAGAVVAVSLLVLFGADLGVGFPFGGVSKVMDIGFIVCALALGYISWTTLKEQS